MHGVGCGPSSEAEPTKMVLNCGSLQLLDPLITLTPPRNTIPNPAPMIEHLGNVMNMPCPFAHPEHEFEILHKIEGRVEATHLDCQCPPHRQQMTDKHDAAEEMRR